jgi:hypothetical protein
VIRALADARRSRAGGLVADVVVVLPAFVLARVLVFVAWLVAGAARGGSDPTARLRAEGLLAWDGTWYQDIIEFGYVGAPETAERFFPGYPVLAGVLAAPFGSQASTWTLVLVANVSALVAAVLVRRLVLAERGDTPEGRTLADRSAITLTLFPTAFVLVWAYSEALFLVGAVGAFWMVRTNRWWWAVPFGLVAGFTRPLGLLLVVPFAVEAARPWWDARRRGEAIPVTGWLARAAATLAPAFAAGLWAAWVGAVLGDPMSTFTIQGELRGETTNPVVRLLQGFGDLFGPEVLGDGLHLPFVVAAVVLVVVAFRRWPVSYGLFGALVVAVALAAENLNSFERYALNGFPVVLALAALATTQRRAWGIWLVGSVGLVALSTLAWTGTYVP